jgi:hypothetical protein
MIKKVQGSGLNRVEQIDNKPYTITEYCHQLIRGKQILLKNFLEKNFFFVFAGVADDHVKKQVACSEHAAGSWALLQFEQSL